LATAIDESELYPLIGGIYDCVIAPELWPEVTERIRQRLGRQLGMLGAVSLPDGESVIYAAANVPKEYEARAGHYNADILEMWGGAERVARLPVEEPMIHSEVTPASSWVHNRYYIEWARPQGLVDQVAVMLENSPRLLANIAFGRHESMPPLGEFHRHVMRVLAPHLRRAVIISGMLDTGRRFEATLDTGATAIVLVDRAMRVVHANQSALAMIGRGDCIRVADGRLELTNELVPEQLAMAVRMAADDETALARRGMGIPGRRSDGAPVIAHVMPLARRRNVAWLAPQATAAVFITGESAEPELPIAALSALYGLRPAEARVFELIVAGCSSREIGDRLMSAPSTVKTHMLRLYDKLGQHRRSDLVKLARDLSAP
jgi:DNA-binding CsgD family transcriptional regulator